MPFTPPAPAPPSPLSVCQPWANPQDVVTARADQAAVLGGADPVLVAAKLQAATDLLWRLSGRQFSGQCQATVRPCCRPDGTDHFAGSLWAGWNWSAGGWGLGTAGLWLGGDHAHRVRELQLYPTPVASVDQVTVDGLTVDPTAYVLRGHRTLIALATGDTRDCGGFPIFQPLHLDTSHVGTMQVSYTYGTPPPQAGRDAVAYLAAELVLLTVGPAGSCRLPSRVTSVSAQGATVAVLDPQKFLADGRTGIPLVDYFLISVNPKALRRAPRVISPDTVRMR